MTGRVTVPRALLRRVLEERLGYSPASSEFGIVSQLRDAVGADLRRDAVSPPAGKNDHEGVLR